MNMHTLEVNLMIDVESLIWKIDTFAIEKLVSAHEAAPTLLDRDTGVMLVCRKDWQKFKQFDHWTRKGMACYSVILPYETSLSEQTSKEALTAICTELVLECLQHWAEKRRKKAMRSRTKKAA